MNDFVMSLMLLGAISSGNEMPFWATTNQWGLMPQNNGSLCILEAKSEFDTSKTFQWRWGASAAANYEANHLSNESNPLLMVDQLYVSGKWNVFKIDVGMKHSELDFIAPGERLGSMSVTGGHIIESGNARSMPGYNITIDPVKIPWTGNRLWLFGEFGDYKSIDNRYVSGALIHRQKLFLRYDITNRLDFTLGLDHYALWGGHHPTENDITVNLENYIRMCLGLHANSSGTLSDQINVIGDQGGGELIKLRYRGNGYTVTLQHDIPYSDMSGMGFQNFPDGVNTIHFGFEDKERWVSDLLYEYQYTKWQSGQVHDRPATEKEIEKGIAWKNNAGEWRKTVGGCDNYFNNSFYRSGWTNYGRVIGNPLFITGYGADGVAKIVNNRLTSHHISLSGKLFCKAPYKIMITYSSNYGCYSQIDKRFDKDNPLRQVSGAFIGEIPHLLFKELTFTYGFYADKGSLYQDQIGASAGLRFKF